MRVIVDVKEEMLRPNVKVFVNVIKTAWAFAKSNALPHKEYLSDHV